MDEDGGSAGRAERLAQVLVPDRDVGLDGEDLGPVRRPWSATQVPSGA